MGDRDASAELEGTGATRPPDALVESLSRVWLESIPVLVTACDREGRIVLWNRRCELVMGFAAQEVVGRRYWDVLHPESERAAAAAAFERALREGVPETDESPWRTRTGETRRIFWSRSAVEGPGGDMAWIVASGIDVTERRRAEEALRRSEERFRIVAQKTHQLIYDYHLTTQHIAWVGAIEELTGYTPEEFASVDLDRWVAMIHPDDRDAAVAELDRATMLGVEYDVTYRFLRKDGRYFDVEDRGAFVRDETGEPKRLLGTMSDVTARKQAEEALSQSQKLESLGLLAGGIAHDFNNFLAAIQGNLDLARGRIASGRPAEVFLENVQAGVRQATELTRQLLAYAGHGRTSAEPQELAELVRDTMPLLHVTIGAGVHLRLELDEQLPPILADRTQMQQVLMNLVTNAVEAITRPPGEIIVRARLADLTPEHAHRLSHGTSVTSGPHVMLEVEDSGEGVPAEMQKRIFDPFFTTKTKGHGLGLSVIAGILRSHHGGIEIESAAGRGTVFRLYLPTATAAGPPRATSDRISADALPRRGSVLVVDDEAPIRDVLSTMLESMGWKPIVASDGLSGVRAFEANRDELDLVLMDVTMPHLDGKNACRRILEIDPNARVLLMSGFARDGVADAVPEVGARAFLAKPFTMSELARVMKQVLEPTHDARAEQAAKA